ncbi:MAG: class I SAM-dependent methyltransferase [Microcoleaceae cyanobacterium]
MGDCTNMADYYNLIMTSGYYDDDAIVENILYFYQGGNILEIGCGMGLILEKLINKKSDKVTRIDMTQSMLDIADESLNNFDNVLLLNQNVVTLSLEDQYNIAFSYGGAWYFVRDNQNIFLISHITSDTDNQKGIEQLFRHMTTGGKL